MKCNGLDRGEYTMNIDHLMDNENLKTSKPLKTLFEMYRGNFSKIAISLFFYLIKSLPVYVLPVVTANIINIATAPEKHPLSGLWWNCIVMAIVILQNIPTQLMYISFMSKAIRYVEAGLRGTLIRKLQQLSIGFHGELKSGKLQSKVLRDVEAIEYLSRQIMMAAIPAFINIVVVFGIAFYHSKTVSLFFILTIPASVFIISIFRRRITATNRDFRKQIEEMAGRVSEMVEMIPVTRAHGLANTEIVKIDATLHNIRGKGYRLDIIEAFFGSSSWVIFQIFQLICLLFTAYLAYNGKISAGEVVMYQGFFNMIIGAVTQLINVYPIITKGIESVHSVTEILLSRDTEEYTGRKKIKNLEGTIFFQGVHFHYRDSNQHVLRDLNLEVRSGECVAFIGESGSGKSTILNMLIGFYKPTKGQIVIDGIPMEDMDMQSYRNSLAVVLQNNILFSGSVRDNITYGLPLISEEKLQEVIEITNLRDVIANLPDGLDTLLGEHGGKLSGGQRQRIAIARALIRDPKIIILDEPTSALDNISERHVQKAMERLMHGRTTFIVAHRLSTIQDADTIVVMKKGSVLEKGTYDELMAKEGEFYRLKSMQ